MSTEHRVSIELYLLKERSPKKIAMVTPNLQMYIFSTKKKTPKNPKPLLKVEKIPSHSTNTREQQTGKKLVTRSLLVFEAMAIYYECLLLL